MPSFFVPTPGDLTALESPTREFAIQGKKNANAWGSARGGGGRDKMFACVGLVNRSVFPKRSLVLKSFTIHSLCQAFGQCRWAKKANEKRKKRSKKTAVSLPTPHAVFLHFFYLDPFSLSFLEPGTGYTTQINALIHVTLTLCHLTPVDPAMEESSESESDLPVFEIQR